MVLKPERSIGQFESEGRIKAMGLKAVILAAGEGSRMWPLAVDKPKHILPVAGKPLISHILNALKENLIEEVLVVVGFRGDLIRSAIGDGSPFGLRVEYLEQPAWTGTASALKIAFDAVGREPFLAVYGDLWITPSAIHTVIEKSRHCPRVMGIVHMANASEYGLIELEGDRLVRIVEKPSRKAKPEGWVNAGIYVLDNQTFAAIERTRISKRAEADLRRMLEVMAEGNVRSAKPSKAAAGV